MSLLSFFESLFKKPELLSEYDIKERLESINPDLCFLFDNHVFHFLLGYTKPLSAHLSFDEFRILNLQIMYDFMRFLGDDFCNDPKNSNLLNSICVEFANQMIQYLPKKE